MCLVLCLTLCVPCLLSSVWERYGFADILLVVFVIAKSFLRPHERALLSFANIRERLV